MVEKRLLAVFIVTCALGLSVVLDLFQLHVHSVIPSLCSLPTEPSPEGFQLGDYVCAGSVAYAENFHGGVWFRVIYIWCAVCDVTI